MTHKERHVQYRLLKLVGTVQKIKTRGGDRGKMQNSKAILRR